METRQINGLGGRLLLAAAVCTGLLLLALALRPAPAQAEFGVAVFDGQVNAGPVPDPLPNPEEPADPANFPPAYTQAGGHPFSVTTTIRYNTTPNQFGFPTIDGGQFQDVVVDLPPGFVGNPDAVPECREDQLARSADQGCPLATAIGYVEVEQVFIEPNVLKVPVYNMAPPEGVAAQFAFNIAGVIVHMNASLRSGGDYGVTISLNDVNQGIIVNGSKLTFWGVPAAEAHDGQRGMCLNFGGACPAAIPARAFITLPVDCAAGPLTTRLRTSAWAEPSRVVTAAFTSHLPPAYPAPQAEWGPAQGVTGCENVPFEPSMSVRPTSSAAGGPTGLEVSLSIPQQGADSPLGIASSSLRDAVVTLPEGMSVNAASADGLGSCSMEQLALGDPAPATCTRESKIGAVSVETPLLDHPIAGGVYLAKQRQNKFGSLLAIYLAVHDPETGVVIKLPGKVETSASGRLTATFDTNPQLPFEDLRVEFFGGDNAALTNPPACGTYETHATLTPWSGTPPVSVSSSFEITSGPNGQACPRGNFDPEFSAGTTNPVAGSHSPFVLRLTRADGTQILSSLSATIPKGLLGSLKGIPYCPEPALATVSSAEGTGAAQLASPACPKASQLGTVTVGVGAGPSPFYVQTGKAYLAGPYRGAPLSLAFIAPALAGPFDLGSVVVRAALRVNPTTAQITAASDPLPAILHGIPLSLRDVRVNLDRPRFTLNPTSCEQMAFSGSATSAQGAVVPLRERFQATNCAALDFAPKLSFRYKGKTNRSAHPAVTATLKARKGDANIGKAVVTLPKTQFLEQGHIRTICTRVQYAANSCPKGSVYGYAKAWTPLLDQPLQGPVVLRSSNNTLPDLVADLNGQIDIDLAGRIDSVNSRMRVSFGAVPDAPVSKFVLRMQGGKKGLLVNNTELCRAKPRASVRLAAHSGRALRRAVPVRMNCPKSR